MAEIKLERLEKHKDKLDACIRCGYCYEHCPIYKHTRWETDTPRAKLALLYGIMNGEIEPTPYIAEKLFECFYCKRCEANCSTGIPLMEVFTDARLDFRDAGLVEDGTTSQTDQGSCGRCLTCVRLCKHEARYFDERIRTDPTKCQGCGACLDICPGAAVRFKKSFGTSHDELLGAITRFIRDEENPEAKAIVFCCNWSNYPGFQVARMDDAHEKPEYKVFVTMCAGRLQTRLLTETLEQGAWGALVTNCPEGECEHNGNAMVKARIASLRKVLETLHIDPNRIRQVDVGKGDPKAFKAAVEEFMGALREIGPLGVGE